MQKATDERLIMLGERLKRLRVMHGLTQDDVAIQLDMERTSISKYEHGVLEPPISVTRKIAKMYNVGIETLVCPESTVLVFRDDGEIPGEDTVSYAKLTKEEKKMILRMRLMTPEQKEEIEKIINKPSQN